MAILQVSIATGSDDAGWSGGDSYDATVAESVLGNYLGFQIYNLFRFDNITIPSGSTINSATLEFHCNLNTSGNTVNVRIEGIDEDDPVAPTTTADANGRTRTTATTNWSSLPAWTAGAKYTSPSFAATVQELIDRVGWASGNAMMFYVMNNSSSSNANRAFAFFENTTYDPVLLTIDYTAGSGPQSIDVNLSNADANGNNLTFAPGSIFRTVNLSNADTIGYDLTQSSVVSRNVDNSVSVATGYDIGFNVGAITQAVNLADAGALGNDLVTEYIQAIDTALSNTIGYDVGYFQVISSDVNNASATTSGYDIITLYVLDVNNSNANAIGYNVNRSTGNVNTIPDLANADTTGYGVSTLTGNNAGVELSGASALGYSTDYSVGGISQSVSLANADGIAYDLDTLSGLFIEVNYSDAIAVGNVLDYVAGAINATVATTNAQATGYDLSTQGITVTSVDLATALANGLGSIGTTYGVGVNNASATTQGFDLSHLPGSVVIAVNQSGAIATGYEVETGTFVLVLSPLRTYTTKAQNRTFEVDEQTRIFILKNKPRLYTI